MGVFVRSTFWVAIFGTLGYSLFKICKPDEDTLKKYHNEAKHTWVSKSNKVCVETLKNATDAQSDIAKKVDELLKK